MLSFGRVRALLNLLNFERRTTSDERPVLMGSHEAPKGEKKSLQS